MTSGTKITLHLPAETLAMMAEKSSYFP